MCYLTTFPSPVTKQMQAVSTPVFYPSPRLSARELARENRAGRYGYWPSASCAVNQRDARKPRRFDQLSTVETDAVSQRRTGIKSKRAGVIPGPLIFVEC